MLLQDLLKRNEYNYLDSINFDSLSNQNLLNYPLTKLFVCENVDEEKLKEQIKQYAVDYKYKQVGNLYFVCVSFHTLDDCNNFNNVMNFEHNFDIQDSKNVKYI